MAARLEANKRSMQSLKAETTAVAIGQENAGHVRAFKRVRRFLFCTYNFTCNDGLTITADQRACRDAFRTNSVSEAVILSLSVTPEMLTAAVEVKIGTAS